MGGPLLWTDTNPLLRFAFSSPRLAGALPFRGTRRLAGMVLPIAKRFPPLLSIYMTASRVDLEKAEVLIQTVEDPIRQLNRDLAEWIRDGDLVIGGRNVTKALSQTTVPILSLYGRQDGIVLPSTATAIATLLPEEQVTVLGVGDAERRYAHADLFISEGVQEDVFKPLVAWLRTDHHNQSSRWSG